MISRPWNHHVAVASLADRRVEDRVLGQVERRIRVPVFQILGDEHLDFRSVLGARHVHGVPRWPSILSQSVSVRSSEPFTVPSAVLVVRGA